MIKEVQNWYKSQCDGEWEHEFGIKIYTLDNPGWCVEIDLRHTKFNYINKKWKLTENKKNDWYGVKIENGVYEASGDADKLEFILSEFIKFVNK